MIVWRVEPGTPGFFASGSFFAACRATHTTVMCAAFPHACTGAATPLLIAATARWKVKSLSTGSASQCD